MKKSIKFLIGSGMAVLGSLVFITFAKASDITAENSTTGAFSDNDVNVVVENNNSVDINNDANITNNINIYANTGGNSASRNSGDGIIQTGDVNADVTLETVANITSLDMYGGYGDIDIEAGNTYTGYGSENDVDIRLENDNDVDIDNDANIYNNVDFRAETGDNDIRYGCGDGSIETGDIDLSLSAETTANVVEIGWGDGGDIYAELYNEMTGACSDNDIDLTIENDNDLDIDNDANIRNCIDFDADTGDNEVRNNLFDGDIATGDIDVEFDLETDVNRVSIDNVFGGMGDIEVVASNECTGFGSDNDIDVKIERKNDLNIDNDLDVRNCIDIKAETGDNEVEDNCGGGYIQTGDISVEGNLETIGNIVDIDSGLFGNDISIEASNATTGCDSDNDIEVCVEDENEIDINNDADVPTCLDARLETGCNEVNENCCGGEIVTGDADIQLDASVLVNILGDGDIDFDGLRDNDYIDRVLSGEGDMSIILNGNPVL